MIQIRVHGRGGQGVVTAAELLSLAAFFDGQYAQAFPSFGSERTGAPVTSFCRMSEKEIRSREPVFYPDVVIIQDSTLLHHVDVFGGLSQKGYVLINSTRSLEDLGVINFCSTLPDKHCRAIPVLEIALKHLGRPLANAGLVGGFAGLTGFLSMQAVEKAIQHKFPGPVGDLNMAVAAEAYEQIVTYTFSV